MTFPKILIIKTSDPEWLAVEIRDPRPFSLPELQKGAKV